MIRIDPQELTAAATTIRNAAVETADIGAQLASCAGCPMPPDVGSLVEQIVHVVDQILDVISLRLNADSNDLTDRAAMASMDLATAGSVSGTTPLTSAAVAGAGALIGGGMAAGSASTISRAPMIIGGGSSPSFTIVDPNSGQQIDPTSLMGGMGIVGGHAPTNITIIDTMTGKEVDRNSMFGGQMTIGGGHSYDRSPGMILARAAQRHKDRADALGAKILANPNSSQSDRNAVFNSQLAMQKAAGLPLVPSKSTMESKVGHLLTNSEYYRLVPEARPSSGSMVFF